MMRLFQTEFVRFAMVGVVNTIHYYVIYLFCLAVLDFPYFPAHIVGFTISLIGSFFLNTLYTYKVKPTWGAFLRFPLTQLFNTVATAVFIYVLVEYFYIGSRLAPLVSILFTMPITFLLTGRILKRSPRTAILNE